MKNKNALFFINSFGRGGAERVCINLGNELVSNNYNVKFITLYDKCEYLDCDNFETLNLGISDNSNTVVKLFKIIISIRKINKFIGENKYNLITSHLPLANFVTMVSKVGKNSIYVIHSNINNNIKNGLIKDIVKFLLKKKKVVTVSNELENDLRENYDILNTKTIYNPLVTSNIQLLKEKEVKIDRNYILFVGRLEEVKRVDRLINNYYNGKLYEKCDLVLLGIGSLDNSLKELVKKYNIEKYVKFVGWESNVYKWMNKAECLVLTSDSEAFPMILIEALACSCKVVAGDCSYGPREILSGSLSEFLVKDYLSDTAYIEKIELALKSKIKSNNLDILDKCDAKNVAKEYLDFYKK